MKKPLRILLLQFFLFALVLSFGSAAFADTVTLPAALTEIGAEAFMGDTSLDEVIIPDGVTAIPERAFANSSLRAVHIPASVTSIANDAFSGTEPLYYIENPASFSGNLDDMGTVYVTKRTVITTPVTFHNTTLIIDQGVNFNIHTGGSLEGDRLVINGGVYSYETLKVTGSVSTGETGVLDVLGAGAHTEIPANSYYAGLNVHTNKNSQLTLTHLDEIGTIADITTGDTEAVIENGGDHALFRFVPEESGRYSFSSASSEDTYAVIYNASGERIAMDDDSGEDCNTGLICDLTAGSAYIYDVCYYDPRTVGSIPLTLRCKRIVSHPTDMIILPHETVTFRVEAEGSDLTYQWQMASPGSEDWQELTESGSQSDVLSFEALEIHDRQRYRCVVTGVDDLPEYSEYAMLYVSTRAISIGKTYAEISFGGDCASFFFLPDVSGSYTLSSTGDEDTFGLLYDSTGNLLKKDDDSGLGKNFIITCDLTADTLYFFQTRYFNSDMTGIISLLLKADACGTEITLHPADAITAPGKQASFRVEAEGSDLTYRWQTLLPGSEIWQDAAENGSDTDLLSFAAPEEYDGRQYRCAVTDMDGFTVYSGAATLFIRSDPKIYRALVIGNQYYTLGELGGCHNDTNAMAGMLQGLTNSYFVTSLPDATASQMQSAIRSVFANATEDDVSLFYYSGHGLCYDDDTTYLGALLGVHYGEEDPSDYLVPYTLAKQLSEVPGRVIVILDSCFSGAVIASKGTSTEAERINRNVINAFAAYDNPQAEKDPDAKTEELRKSKFVVFTASKPYEESYAPIINNMRASVFTYSLINACGSDYPSGSYLGHIPADVNGDLCLSAEEAYRYTYKMALSIRAQHALYYAADPDEILFRRN